MFILLVYFLQLNGLLGSTLYLSVPVFTLGTQSLHIISTAKRLQLKHLRTKSRPYDYPVCTFDNQQQQKMSFSLYTLSN